MSPPNLTPEEIEEMKSFTGWWRELTGKGDPERRPRLHQEIWLARAAIAQAKEAELLAEIARLKRLERIHEDVFHRILHRGWIREEIIGQVKAMVLRIREMEATCQ